MHSITSHMCPFQNTCRTGSRIHIDRIYYLRADLIAALTRLEMNNFPHTSDLTTPPLFCYWLADSPPRSHMLRFGSKRPTGRGADVPLLRLRLIFTVNINDINCCSHAKFTTPSLRLNYQHSSFLSARSWVKTSAWWLVTFPNVFVVFLRLLRQMSG
jgi:hypothetical protein